ncbi:MAG: dCTP deaminase [Nitrospinaceae bacterium]
MILSGSDIRKVLRDGLLIIDPLPEEDQIDTTSVDLRMGEPLWMWSPELIRRNGPGLRVDVDRFNFKELSERYMVETPKEESGKYLIKPQTVYLASTFEKVELPTGSRLAARIEGKSSLARLGLAVHITAPTIHCGSGPGTITLEIFNHGPFAIDVTPGVSRLCQLILEEVSSEPQQRTGRIFMEQKTPKG